MARQHDTGIVLRRSPFGESSLVVQVLTRRHGRVHFLAKGAYRPTSGYAFVLDLFHTVSLEWSHSPQRELQLLRRGDLARRRSLSGRADVYRAALMVLELTELAARPAQSERALFELAERCLDELAELPVAPPGPPPGPPDSDPRINRSLARFELGFLDCLGLFPALESCASCGDEAPPVASTSGSRGSPGPRAHFSAGAGGRLCRPCAVEAKASGRRVGTLPTDVLEAAAALVARPESAPADAQLLVRVRDAVERFLNYHLEARPRTQRAFLAVPNRNAP